MLNSLLDALGYVGSSLDKPGAAVRGMLTGDMGQAKNLIPFSDTMGLTDPEQRVSGRGLLQHYGLQDEGDDSLLGGAAGFATELATDPLTYLGGALANRATKGLRGAAMARGPQFGGGLEKLAASGVGQAGEGARALESLKSSPALERLLSEMPEGSKFLGGNNSLAFGTPQGDVLRFGQEPSRLAIPEMLQPTRNVSVGEWRAERLPMAQDVGNRELFQQQYRPMADSLRGQGLHPADLQPGNLGTFQGRPTLIDPGAAVPHPRAIAAGQEFARAPEIAAQDPGRITNLLLDALGYKGWVQGQLAGQAGGQMPGWFGGAASAAGGRAGGSML